MAPQILASSSRIFLKDAYSAAISNRQPDFLFSLPKSPLRKIHPTQSARKVPAQFGKERRPWIMDRGIPTEAVLEELRAADPAISYLVGTPGGRPFKHPHS